MTRWSILAVCTALSACASAGSWTHGPSVARGLQPADVPMVATSIAKFVEMRLKPEAGGIVVDSRDRTLGPAVAADLHADGYDVGTGPNSVRYAVQPLDAQILVMAFLNEDTLATRVFSRQPNGQLQPASPYAIREPAE